MYSAKPPTGRRSGACETVAKPVESAFADLTRDLQDEAATTRICDQRSLDALSSRTYDVDDIGSSIPSSISTPRTYVVDFLPETNDDSSRGSSPRVTDKPARGRRRRRRPQPSDEGRPTVWSLTTLGRSGARHWVEQSSSTESVDCPKTVKSSESLRQGRRRSSSPYGAADCVPSTPNLPEKQRCRLRHHHRRSEGDVKVLGRAGPADVVVPGRESSAAANNFCAGERVSRLPLLVARAQDAATSATSALSATLVHAPRPRSFRYSRLHRRAVSAMVPQCLRDMPWRWARRALNGID